MLKLKLSLVIKTLENHYRIPEGSIFSRTRTSAVALARMIAMYTCVKHGNLTLAQTGEIFDRTHANVLHAVRFIENRFKTDKRFTSTYNKLLKNMYEEV